MSIEGNPDLYIQKLLSYLPPNARQYFEDQPIDELRKNAKELWDQWHADGVDSQEMLYQWVRRPNCLRDHMVAEPRPTVNSDKELVEPVKPIIQLSMEVERERVSASTHSTRRACILIYDLA